MRPLHLFDLDVVVRAALAQPPEMRRRFLEQAVIRADVADRFRKRLGRAHPEYGDGSLATAVAWQERVARAHLDRKYRKHLGMLLAILAEREAIKYRD